MTLLVPWLVFPLVLALLSFGCGLLVRQASGIPLPQALLLPLGFALISVTALFGQLTALTRELTTPVIVALAITGLGLSLPWRFRGVDGWWIGTGLGVFAVFAAPVVLSGHATLLGYIKLDDTATYLAMLDRAFEHGYDASGLAPSTYEATLNTSLVYGYPLGSLLPLGVGRALVAQDAAWLWQPYLAFLAALLGLGVYQLISRVVASRPLRALVACVAASAALLYGYALWGGIKELATAALVVLIAALVPVVVAQPGRPRALLPLAAACAAVLGVLSVGGSVWLAPLLAGAFVLAIRSGGLGGALRTSIYFAVGTAILAIPSLVAAFTWLNHSGAFTSGDEYGNLTRRLSWLQIFGIWPNGDFRNPPDRLDVTYVLTTVVALAAIVGLILAWRRRAWELLLVVASAALACAIYVGAGSPWIGGKALATSSPMILAAALAGAAALFEGGRRVEALTAGAVIIAAVAFSDALQYRAAFVAPEARLADLAEVGETFSGQGPTLMTEYEPYGARHFLRSMATEGASELRRHTVPLRTGGVADPGVSVDLDELRLDAVLYYRTLVLRRSAVASRPPSVYRLLSRHGSYEVWQRGDKPSRILEHLSLGSRLQPVGTPACSEILRLADLARANDGRLAAVPRPETTIIASDGTLGAPTSFGRYGEASAAFYAMQPYTMAATIPAPVPDLYGIWVAGTFRSEIEVTIDGKRIGSARGQLNWPSTFASLGAARLQKGPHRFRLRYSGPDLHPGSGDEPPFGLGPVAIGIGTADRPVTFVDPAQARSLCGRSLDWVEALRR